MRHGLQEPGRIDFPGLRIHSRASGGNREMRGARGRPGCPKACGAGEAVCRKAKNDALRRRRYYNNAFRRPVCEHASGSSA